MGFDETEQKIIDIVNRHSEARQIIIFAPCFSWDEKYLQRPQQLARAFARRGALVFYMQPEHFKPAVFTELEERLIVCQTPAEAFRVVPNAFVYVLTWNIPLLAYFESPHVIYDYSSDLLAIPGKRQQLKRNHGNYLYKADLVLVASEKLYQKAVLSRTDCLLCPNGAEPAHFANSASPVPEDLSPILSNGKPVIGYYGTMEKWFDYEFVRRLAISKPDYSFVLVGSDNSQALLQTSGLLNLPNVYWLGPKPYVELPLYIRHFQIGLIPFVVNDITHTISPIELFEYFSSGKPVVVSAMEESSRYADVLVASTPQEWQTRIEQALSLADDAHYVEHLRAVGQQNSWDARADSILEQLAARPPQPRAPAWHVRFQPHNARLMRILHLTNRAVKVWQMSGIRGVINSVSYKVKGQLSRLRRSGFFWLSRSLDDTYVPEDNSQVVLYTSDPRLFPDYWPRHELTRPTSDLPHKVSMISTTFNEEKYIVGWLDSILSQSILPDEIVIVDGGSTDGTLNVLSAYSEKSSVPLRVIQEKGARISRGRNLAIENARHEIIVVTDCGCHLQKGWLENIVAPFQIEPGTEVVAGWYSAIDRQGGILPFRGWPSLADVDPQTFVPSSRSIAFTKAAWKKAGGYPEWLSLTGEDTYFALELKRYCSRWAFVPSAVVEWYGPESWSELWKKAYSWSIGDGESGYNAWLFRKMALQLVTGGLAIIGGYLVLGLALGMLVRANMLIIWGGCALGMALFALLGISIRKKDSPQNVFGNFGLRISRLAGFWSGARRKAAVDQRRLALTKGICFILAGPPIEDTGGGGRNTQISLELLRQNYWVVYVHRYPSWESIAPVLRIAHPNLFTYNLGEFNWDDFINNYGTLLKDRSLLALVEFPTSEFLPLMREIKEWGGKVTYDMIDDWNTSLGNWGYSAIIEREIIRVSDDLVATAPALKEKLEAFDQRSALLLPNAVNSRLFNPNRLYQRPDDLPNAAWLGIYIGALWGDWFDWDLFVAVANAYPEAAFAAVGDYRGQCPNPPSNLHFLGLKPQTILPAYLAHSDVTIIPWKVNEITQATSPLKLYEYLAMHKPVVAPDLMPLREIPGVLLANSSSEFIRLVDKAHQSVLPVNEIDSFISNNNWQMRVRQLLNTIDRHEKSGSKSD